MDNYPKRGDVYWVHLDPTFGSEINKIRPAVIVSNDAGNERSLRVIIAPITSSTKYVQPFEVETILNGKKGKALLDQIRAIDKSRLGQKITSLDLSVMRQIDKALKIALRLS